MNNVISIEEARSYATVENCVKAIEKYNLSHLRHIICYNSAGRCTVVFLVSEHINKHGGYAGIAARHGFMSV